MKRLISLVFLMVGSVQAADGVIDFDNLTPAQLGPAFGSSTVYHQLGFSVDVDGFNFSNPGKSDGSSDYGLSAVAEDERYNPGGFTIQHRASYSVTTMTKLDGLPFSVASVDVGNHWNTRGYPTSVTFSADLLGGTTISKTITTDGFHGLETIDLGWWGVTAFYVGSDTTVAIQIDNIALTPQPPTPDPIPLPVPNQIVMDFDDIDIEDTNRVKAYGFNFVNAFYGGVGGSPMGAPPPPPPSVDGASLFGLYHHYMTPINDGEFGLESVDLYFWHDGIDMNVSDTWVLRGYNSNGKGIAELTVQRPTASGQWVSVDLDPIWHSGLSRVDLIGQTSAYGLFVYMDNLVVNLPATEVDFDVQPWFTQNDIDPASTAMMPVAIMTTSTADGDAVDFDALLVDPATVKFGYGEAPAVGGATPIDFDGDLDSDILLGFAIQDAGIICEDTELTVSGETTEGEEFFGVDSINTTNCETSSCHP